MRPFVTTGVLLTLAALTLAAAPALAQRGVDPAWAESGAGIVEVAHPAGDPCADLSVPGCIEFDGDTVWHDENSTADYYVSSGSIDGAGCVTPGDLGCLSRYIEAAVPDAFEMRFTADGGYAVYGFEASGFFPIATVPFELWYLGETPDDPADDVRMIPFLFPNVAGVFVTDWEGAFTGVDPWPLSNAPITELVYWMMPDRPNGYDLFEQAAINFGGAGALYDRFADGDTQIDPDPMTGADCEQQGVYVDFCYRNQVFAHNGGSPSQFIYPIGRMVFADAAGNGTTPPTGTVVRFFSETGAPTFADWADNGGGIVETDSPAGDPCADPGTIGCEAFGGNTVWHDPNVDADYYVGSGSATEPGIAGLRRYVEAAVPDAFEIRFTAQGSAAVYGFVAPPPFPIARVPFELWNIGDPDDPDDDVRMIPFLNANADPVTDWEDAFTGTDPWPLSDAPITDWIYWMMPDRPNGYDLFEEAALGFGGPGALYDPTADGDDQVDPDPSDGSDCDNQGVYVDYCYRNNVLTGTYTGGTFGAQFVYPVGRMVFADLAADGTTPPTGTVIRLHTEGNPPPVGTGDGPEAPEAFALLPVSPNPFAARAAVPFTVPAAGHVRVAIYDLLGREVAVLADGLHAVGRHEAALDGARLASGVYVVVLEAERGVRATRKVTLLR